MNRDGLHHKESHLLQGIKISFLVIAILAKKFGHKAINCRINERNTYARNMNGLNRRYGNNCGFFKKNYNSFSPLMEKLLYAKNVIILVTKHEIVDI